MRILNPHSTLKAKQSWGFWLWQNLSCWKALVTSLPALGESLGPDPKSRISQDPKSSPKSPFPADECRQQHLHFSISEKLSWWNEPDFSKIPTILFHTHSLTLIILFVPMCY